jgi:trigger factor
MSFQSTVEDIDEITKRLLIQVPSEMVSKEYEASLTSVAKSAHIKGFRPGKVPRNIIERQMGDRVRFDVVNRLMSDALKAAYEQHKLDVVGQPEVDFNDFDLTKSFEFSATVSLYPTPTIENYLNRTVKVVKKEVADKDVEQSLERLLESKAEIKPVEGRTQAEKGDVVALAVEVRVEDGEFSRGEPFVDVLGSGKLSSSVEEQVVGMAAGETKEIGIVAGDDHPNPELRGKNVTYKVMLHGMFTKNLPVLDDAFVKGLGLEVETVDALKAKVKEQLAKQVEADLKSETQGALLDLLVNENPFKVPSAMVDDEIRGLVSHYGFAGRGAKPESIDVNAYRPQFEEFALNRIRCAIIIDRVGSSEKISVEDADRDRMIERLAEQNGSTVEATRKAVLDKSRIFSFLLEVRRTKILDHLLANTTVEFAKGEESAQAAA